MAEDITVTLNNGAKMPVVGFGLAEDDTILTKGCAPVGHIKTSVLTAIQVGYRAFDTASTYFTEGVLGESLKGAIEKGLVSREEVFVTSKLASTDCYPEDVIPALRKSLEALKLEYLDLYLIHSSVAHKKGVIFPHITPDDVVSMDIQGVWRAMEECVELGLTRAIGVSNFSCKKISDLLGFSKIPPAVNQVEMHPGWQQKRFREFCKSVNVHVSAWSPLGGPGTSWGSNNTIDSPLIKEVATKHAKTPAQVPRSILAARNIRLLRGVRAISAASRGLVSPPLVSKWSLGRVATSQMGQGIPLGLKKKILEYFNYLWSI